MLYNRKNFASTKNLNFFFTTGRVPIDRLRVVLQIEHDCEKREKNMPVQAVQPNTNQNRSSYIRAGLLGAIGGYAAKHLLPVSEASIDEYISQTALKARKLSSSELKGLAKLHRSTFDYTVITAIALMAYTFFKNMYSKLADKS